MRSSLCTRAVMALVALAAIGGLSPADDRPTTIEMARARAEACVAIAKATGSQPCQSQECKLAEVKAEEQIVLAKLGSKRIGIGAGRVAASCQCSNGVCTDCVCPPGECLAAVVAKVTKEVTSPSPAKGKASAPTTKKTAAGYTFSADGRTLTYDDGRVFTRRTDGVYWPAGATATISATSPVSISSGGGCYTVNGRTVCPTR